MQKKNKNYAKGKQIITIQNKKKSQYCLSFVTAIIWILKWETEKKMVAVNAFGFNGFAWPTECPTILNETTTSPIPWCYKIYEPQMEQSDVRIISSIVD